MFRASTRWRVVALVAVLLVAIVAVFQGCGGKIAPLPDAGADAAPDAYVDETGSVDAGFDAPLDADADADVYDAYDAPDVWDGYYDPYTVPPDPFDAASFPPCLDTKANPDPGAPSDVYPAFHPAMPTVVSAPGPTLATPTIVPITFAGDPLADQIEQFVAGLGQSSYWQSFSSGFGIAPPISNPVRITDPYAPAMTDGMVEELITRKLIATPPTLPTSANTLYAVFLPPGVPVRAAGGGHWDPYTCAPYHYMTIISGRPNVPYAVIPSCDDGTSQFSGIDAVTMRASYVMIGALLNPNPSNVGHTVDPAHYMWSFLAGPDPTDLCTSQVRPHGHAGIPYEAPDFPYWVQRQWSNDASNAYGEPCQPGDPSDGPFFAAVPVAKDPVNVGLDPPFNDQEVQTVGVDIPQKLCRVIEVDLLSNQKLDTPMTVTAFESGSLYTICSGSMCATPKLSLQFQWDRQQGQNGEKLYLTVARNGTNPAGYDAFFIQASYNGKTRRWPVVLGDSFPP